MPRILKIFIIVLIVAAIASGALLFFVNRRIDRAAPEGQFAQIPPPPQLPQETASPSPSEQIPAPSPAPAVPADPIVQLRADLAQLASSFTERWGAASTAQSITPIASLYPFMTATMRAYAISQVKQQDDTTLFRSVQTRALNTRELSLRADEGTASYLVATQRVERVGSVRNQRVFYQDLEVRLRKEGGLWKVDGAYWREKSE